MTTQYTRVPTGQDVKTDGCCGSHSTGESAGAQDHMTPASKDTGTSKPGAAANAKPAHQTGCCCS